MTDEPNTPGPTSIRILGGAGPAEAAAIAAVVDAVLQEERQASRRTNSSRLSDWVAATRIGPFTRPLR